MHAPAHTSILTIQDLSTEIWVFWWQKHACMSRKTVLHITFNPSPKRLYLYSVRMSQLIFSVCKTCKVAPMFYDGIKVKDWWMPKKMVKIGNSPHSLMVRDMLKMTSNSRLAAGIMHAHISVCSTSQCCATQWSEPELMKVWVVGRAYTPPRLGTLNTEAGELFALPPGLVLHPAWFGLDSMLLYSQPSSAPDLRQTFTSDICARLESNIYIWHLRQTWVKHWHLTCAPDLNQPFTSAIWSRLESNIDICHLHQT